jgi:hypothetical protein
VLVDSVEVELLVSVLVDDSVEVELEVSVEDEVLVSSVLVSVLVDV